jgi:hypothetical protein
MEKSIMKDDRMRIGKEDIALRYSIDYGTAL